ncbi:hypothetical protein J3R83DRAFT_7512 [Lanmaoa asiatica]|nr:hypothetical protein J3R83DRAFT_7768 [Lanmaoa asiatica]KAH0826026.1 hypothetical protein J3R83DRAFT_7512 [Lanmaoa asiatica]
MTLSDWDNLEPAHGQGTERARVRDYSTTSSRTSPLSTILDLFSLDVESPAVKMVYQNMNGTRPPEARADNAIPGADKEVHLEYIRDDIRDIISGANDKADNPKCLPRSSSPSLPSSRENCIGGDQAQVLAESKNKEISKNSVVDDMVDANRLLYKPPIPGTKGKAAKGEHPDHIIVIKYVPAVGDSGGPSWQADHQRLL